MNQPVLLPDSETRQALLERASELVDAMFSDQPDWKVIDTTLTSDAVRERIAGFDYSEPRAPQEVLEQTFALLRDCGLHVGHPGYFGLFNPTPSFMGVVADLLVAAFNPQMGAWHHHPAGVEIERQMVLYFARAFGLPDTAYGHFTSGGSEANLTAVNVALARMYPGLAKHGLRALDKQPVMFISEEAHHSLDKVAQQLGLGLDAVIRVPVQGPEAGMDPAALEQAINQARADGLDPFLVVATAGTTNAGIIDPLRQVGAICRLKNLHFHVDGAWGGSLVLSDKYRGLLGGIEHADSLILDAHKLLSSPMGAGIFLSADKAWQAAAFDVEPAYVPRSKAEGMDNYRLSSQFSRRFIGLKLFMTLAAAGKQGMAETIDTQVELGELLGQRLQEDGWRVVNGARLGLVCFENPDVDARDEGERARYYEAIARHVVDGGESWVSATQTVGRPVLRACITSYRTREAHLDRLVSNLREARAKI